MGDEPPARIVAVPLVARNRAVAVLYADSANLDSEAINLEALETLVRVSGMAVELLAARSAPAIQPTAPPVEETRAEAPAEERPAEEIQAPEPHAYTPVAEYDEITPVVEESAPAPAPPEVVPEPVESAPQRVVDEPEPVEAAPPAMETPVEAPAMETPVEAPAMETPVEAPAETVAPPAAAETATPSEAPRRRYGADVELPVEVGSDEERRHHNDARRFARLLVSEIKLYNEQKVIDGRTQSDLYPRLREYIDRSREMYDKRVKPEVAQKYDYFHHELVNTLAEGDAAKLGSAYPGATVSA